jgi:hypothetical protein
MPFVGRRVLGESTTRLAYLPALVTDPGAARGGRHRGRWEAEVVSGESKNEGRDTLNVMPELASLTLATLFRNTYVPPIGFWPTTVSVRRNYSHCLLDCDRQQLADIAQCHRPCFCVNAPRLDRLASHGYPLTEKRGPSVGTGDIHTPPSTIHLFSSVGPTWVI